MLYTLGYTGRKPVDVHQLAIAHRAMLVDICFSPRSRAAYWQKGALERLLGDRYVHLQALGNVNYRTGGPVQLADYATGKAAIERLLAQGWAVILMCVCADVQQCHRLVAAERLYEDFRELPGVTLTHLSPHAQAAQLRLLVC